VALVALALALWFAAAARRGRRHGAGLARDLEDVRRESAAMAVRADQDQDVLRALLAASPAAVLITDPQRRIVATNGLAERFFGGGRVIELVDQPLIGVVRDHEVDDLLRQCLAGAAPVEPILVAAQGRHLRVWAGRIASSAGHLWGGLLVVADQSEMHHLRTVRRDFVANISHELRTPLATIRLLLETLQNGALEEQATAEHFLAKMDLETQHLVGLVEQLLELSRIEADQNPLRRHPTALAPLVATVLERESSFAEQRGVALRNDVPHDLPAASADAEKVGRVLLNLVHNAIKFSPTGQGVRVEARQHGAWLTVDVHDQGAGISATDLPRIFERFYRSDRARARGDGSTGLGLAIARHIVEAHGGRIWAESTEGEGATFSFTLPTR